MGTKAPLALIDVPNRQKLNLKEGAWIWRTFGGGCIRRLNDCRVQYKKCVLYSFPLLVKHVKVLCIVYIL